MLKTASLLAVAGAALAAPEVTSIHRRDCSPQLVTYDYIIVGGGTAGNALATRLTHVLKTSSILVIEAGPAAPDELGINVPGRKGTTLGGKYDWNFTTVPQSAIGGRVVNWNRGKVLGGSSALNLMVYDRASIPEYDAWEELGSKGWNWNSMIAAMIKSENFTGKNTDTYGSAGVGSDGPVHAVINRIRPAHQDPWIPTLVSLGLPTNKESLGGNPIGAMLQPCSVDPTHYNRSYSANAYLPLAGPNLKIMTNTRVAKIDCSKSRTSRRARCSGVILEDGTKIVARHEVILSAGTIQSPGLLELSGIGQPAVLQAANITTLVNLPGVGENLQDHIRVQAAYQLKDNFTSFDIFKYDPATVSRELAKWIAGNVSLYDYAASAYGFANWNQVIASSTDAERLVSLARATVGNSSNAIDRKKLEYLTNPKIPQLELLFSDGYTGAKGYPANGTALYGKGFFTILAGHMHPLGRGSIHINASAPLGKPVINPHYLDNEYDIQALVESIKFVRKLATTAPLRDVWVSEYEPGLDAVTTDAQWREYVKNVTNTIYHPTSTCAMLPRAKGGVVDASLRVYGTTNLRVVDASIIPIQVSAHIQTAVYGIAERAADIIAGGVNKEVSADVDDNEDIEERADSVIR